MNSYITTFEENECYCQFKHECRSNVNDLDIAKISECANYEK